MKYYDQEEWLEFIHIPDEFTPVKGGAPSWDDTSLTGGYANVSAAMLANRTRYLKNQMDQVVENLTEVEDKNALHNYNNLSDVENKVYARANLGLGSVDNTRDIDKPIPTSVAEALDTKVDKVAGKGLSEANFTTEEKEKLAVIEEHYRGVYPTLAALQSGATSPNAGDYADVDTGAGQDINRYIWDVTDTKWVVQSGAVTEVTAAQVKSLYESNANTNAFTDTEKTKLTGLESADKAQVLAGASSANYLSPDSYVKTITWLDSGSVSGTFTPVLTSSLNHKIAATAATTIAAPTGATPGKCGEIIITLSAAAIISWNTAWKFLGAIPNISAAGETWVVSYKVFDSTTIYASAAKVA